LYTLLMTGIYSAIPYKTPWCMVQFLHPMILLAGVGAAALVRATGSVPARAVVCALLVVGASHLGRQAQAADLRYYADNRNPYVYAQPVNDVKRLADWIERLAAVHPDGRRMLVKVISPHPWPLPWYLRRMERVGCWEELPEDPHAPVVIVTSDLQPTLDPRIYEGYHTSHYGMRPGVVMLVYVDRALWDEFARRLSPQSTVLSPRSDGRRDER
jgi:predicted membrane-bound mannosyltransferase